nr:hypothetical protein CcurKRNrm1_p067 [Cryptomonas curvata]UXY87828.1 hypothetical protein CcurKRNrm2_p137 [Cryptomonas curvata]
MFYNFLDKEIMSFTKTNVLHSLQNWPVVKKLDKLGRASRIFIKKQPKINKMIINFGKLYNMVSVYSKNVFEKILRNIQYLIKLFFDYMNYLGIYIIDFIIESPTSIIDLIIYSDKLTRMELGRIFFLICITFNSFRIILSLKRLPCNVLYCPNYTGGFRTQRRIIQRHYIQWTITALVCTFFTAQTAKLRLIEKITSLKIYKQQVLVYFLLVIIWYDLGYKVWFFKQDNPSNDYIFEIISVEKFKKTLKQIYAERYNNRKYNQPNFKGQGNINIYKATKIAGNKDIIVKMRILSSIENNSSNNNSIFNKKWENMDYRFFRKIVKSLNKYSLSPKFLSIFLAIEPKKKKKPFNTDLLLSNWNLFFIIVIFSLTVVEGWLEYQKKNKNYKKSSEKNKN